MKTCLVAYNMVRREDENNGILLLLQDRKYSKEDCRRRVPAAGLRNNLAVGGDIDLFKMPQYLIIVVIAAYDPYVVAIKDR